MAIRDTLRANAAPCLQPGEVVQAAFSAQTVSQWYALLTFWILIIANSYRVVVATDRRILVCRSGKLRMTPVNEVLRELPRSTRIGPAHGLWYRTDALGERLYIGKRFHKDIIAADAVAGAGAGFGTASPAGGASGEWAPDPTGRHQLRYWDGAVWTERVTDQGVQSTDRV